MDHDAQSRNELLAAVPHVLGFKPEEPIVLVPFRPGLPVTRVDLPKTAADCPSSAQSRSRAGVLSGPRELPGSAGRLAHHGRGHGLAAGRQLCGARKHVALETISTRDALWEDLSSPIKSRDDEGLRIEPIPSAL